MRRQSLILSCILLVSTGVFAQEIGQQGTDPFTGQPASPVPPVTLPDTTPKPGLGNREDRLVFKSHTILVQVPTVVTDKAGNHIRNLTRDDFEISEDGKQQKITTFEEVTAAARPTAASTFPGTFSNLAFDGQQTVAISVIALDTINTPFLDQAYGRKQLIKYLADTLDSGHVFGLIVMGSKGIKVLGGINSDPATLIAALKRASAELSPMETFGADGKALAAAGDASELTGGIAPGEDGVQRLRRFILNADALEGSYEQSRAIEDTMRAFLAIAWSLSGIPGRKSLIWATGGFPFTLDSPSSLPGGSLSALYERAMEALKNAQVAVYPVDVRGLVSTLPNEDATYSGALNGPGIGEAASSRSWLQAETVHSMVNFAEMTGGRAYYNSNDLTAGFKRAADDSSSYYLLGYYTDTHNTKPGWRKLQVQLQGKNKDKDKEWEVRARTGVFFTNAALDPQLTHKADIEFALSSPFDSTGIPVTMQWQPPAPDGDKKPSAVDNKKKIGFALRLPATSVIEESDKNRFDVDFIAQATRRGAPAGNAAETIKGVVPASALDRIKAEGIFYRNALELPPGEYQVRFVVRDNLSGRIGSVSAPLTVN